MPSRGVMLTRSAARRTADAVRVVEAMTMTPPYRRHRFNPEDVEPTDLPHPYQLFEIIDEVAPIEPQPVVGIRVGFWQRNDVRVIAPYNNDGTGYDGNDYELLWWEEDLSSFSPYDEVTIFARLFNDISSSGYNAAPWLYPDNVHDYIFTTNPSAYRDGNDQFDRYMEIGTVLLGDEKQVIGILQHRWSSKEDTVVAPDFDNFQAWPAGAERYTLQFNPEADGQWRAMQLYGVHNVGLDEARIPFFFGENVYSGFIEGQLRWVAPDANDGTNFDSIEITDTLNDSDLQIYNFDQSPSGVTLSTGDTVIVRFDAGGGTAYVDYAYADDVWDWQINVVGADVMVDDLLDEINLQVRHATINKDPPYDETGYENNEDHDYRYVQQGDVHSNSAFLASLGYATGIPGQEGGGTLVFDLSTPDARDSGGTLVSINFDTRTLTDGTDDALVWSSDPGLFQNRDWIFEGAAYDVTIEGTGTADPSLNNAALDVEAGGIHVDGESWFEDYVWFTNGSYTALIADLGENCAGLFYNSVYDGTPTRAVELGGSSIGVEVYDATGTERVELLSLTNMGYFYDGTQELEICNATYALEAVVGHIGIARAADSYWHNSKQGQTITDGANTVWSGGILDNQAGWSVLQLRAIVVGVGGNRLVNVFAKDVT